MRESLVRFCGMASGAVSVRNGVKPPDGLLNCWIVTNRDSEDRRSRGIAFLMTRKDRANL